MACDEVVELITGDIHSQSAVSSLITIRDEECEIFKINKQNPEDARRFNITIVPSVIDRSRKSLRQGHKVFVDKIFKFIKDKFSSEPRCDDIFFRGYVGRSHSIYGQRPIKLLRSEKVPGKSHDVAVMVNDVKRILRHCISGTQEDMTRHASVFPWVAVSSISKCESELQSLLDADSSGVYDALYILRSRSDPSLYKIGHSKRLGLRIKALKSTVPVDWKLIKAFCSTKAVVLDLEDKLLEYFSTPLDVGETIRIRKDNVISTLFQATLGHLKNRVFIESLLLES